MTAHALLFTDLVDSTSVAERLGDARTAELWAKHDRLARALLARHDGREIDRADGFFLLFDEPTNAVRFALGYHRALEELELSARSGLHVGAVSFRANSPDDIARGAKQIEVEGLAKPLAARVMALAQGGQLLLTRAGRDALGHGLPEGAGAVSHGHYRIKGIAEPVEVFEVGLENYSPFVPPPDSDKSYRVVRQGDDWVPVRKVRHNLPAERDVFVGRSAELRELARHSDAGARLLTLVGTGGTGKTRLIRRFARSWLGNWPGGVYFCDLSETRSLDGIFSAVAGALDVVLDKGEPVEQLSRVIAGRGQCMIILDNFEQIIQHAEASVGRWLDQAACAFVVVTSRELLHLPGEHVMTVGPLPIIDEGVELFIHRARAQRSEFTLNDGNREAVRRIVALLDGLPLAIELAAARVRLLSPDQLIQRLDDRFKLLAGSRGAAVRQNTLRAAIDWSWTLLNEWEQAVLAQCSIFDGGFTLAAAEAVLELSHWQPAPSAMDAIQALVDKSLLSVSMSTGADRQDLDEPYFKMYVSIHEYAADKLRLGSASEVEALEVRHGEYFSRDGRHGGFGEFVSHGGATRLRAGAGQIDNLVTACRRAIRRGDSDIAITTYRAACRVLVRRGPFKLGVELGAQVVALNCDDRSLLAAALSTFSFALKISGNWTQAERVLLEAFELAHGAADEEREASVVAHLGNLERETGRFDAAMEHLQAALAIFQKIGDRSSEGNVLVRLGCLHVSRGSIAVAEQLLEQALVILREIGNIDAECFLLLNLSGVLRMQGRLDAAIDKLELALSLSRELADRSREAQTLLDLGVSCFDQGKKQLARTYIESSLAINRELGDPQEEAQCLAMLAETLDAEGSLDEAQTLYATALALVPESGNRLTEAMLLSCFGRLEQKQGRVAESLERFQGALAIHRALGNRLDQSVVLCEIGAILTSQGRVGEAREALSESERRFRESGHTRGLVEVLCRWAQLEISTQQLESARASLNESQQLAAMCNLEPNSELANEIACLHEALGNGSTSLGAVTSSAQPRDQD